jgi:hypothetical protein
VHRSPASAIVAAANPQPLPLALGAVTKAQSASRLHREASTPSLLCPSSPCSIPHAQSIPSISLGSQRTNLPSRAALPPYLPSQV